MGLIILLFFPHRVLVSRYFVVVSETRAQFEFLRLLRTLSLSLRLGFGCCFEGLVALVALCVCVWVVFALHFAIEASVFHAHLQFAPKLPMCYLRLKDLAARLELQRGASRKRQNQLRETGVSLSCSSPSPPTRLGSNSNPFTHLLP